MHFAASCKKLTLKINRGGEEMSSDKEKEEQLH